MGVRTDSSLRCCLAAFTDADEDTRDTAADADDDARVGEDIDARLGRFAYDLDSSTGIDERWREDVHDWASHGRYTYLIRRYLAGVQTRAHCAMVELSGFLPGE